MHDSELGNGKALAELMATEFPTSCDVSVGDVKTISARTVAQDPPQLLILGGAIRKFMGPAKSKKWLTKLSQELTKAKATIPYGTAFLTHMMPHDTARGYQKRFRKNVVKSLPGTDWFGEFLSAQVKGIKGPFIAGEMDNAKKYIKDVVNWAQL